MLESRVYKTMGHLKMEQIKPPHLLEFYRNLAEEGIREDKREGKLSNSIIHHHHRMLSALFNDAVEWGIITFNPASRVKLPKVQKKQALCYDEEQLAGTLDMPISEPPMTFTAIT